MFPWLGRELPGHNGASPNLLSLPCSKMQQDSSALWAVLCCLVLPESCGNKVHLSESHITVKRDWKEIALSSLISLGILATGPTAKTQCTPQRPWAHAEVWSSHGCPGAEAEQPSKAQGSRVLLRYSQEGNCCGNQAAPWGCVKQPRSPAALKHLRGTCLTNPSMVLAFKKALVEECPIMPCPVLFPLQGNRVYGSQARAQVQAPLT